MQMDLAYTLSPPEQSSEAVLQRLLRPSLSPPNLHTLLKQFSLQSFKIHANHHHAPRLADHMCTHPCMTLKP